jgi:hypothetical protein
MVATSNIQRPRSTPRNVPSLTYRTIWGRVGYSQSCYTVVLMSDGDAKEWVTVKVPREDKAKADDYRPEGSTFGDCLVAGADRLNGTQATDMSHRVGNEMDAGDLAAYLVDELGAAAGGPQVDDSDIAADVVRQFDYAELASRVADEIEGRMR